MDEILIDVVDAVRRVQLNRPDKKNAITAAMYDRLATALRTSNDDAGTRVVLLTGAGDTFTAGNDVRDFLEHPPQAADSPAFRFMRAITSLEKPLVAAVHGAAIGIGTTMLFHCDLVYAAEGTRFQMPFVNLGLVPELGSSLTVPALVGHQRASALLLLGQPFDAQAACAMGLVNEVVKADELVDRAMAVAQALAVHPPTAVRLTKALLKRNAAQALDRTLGEEAALFVQRLVSPEAKEAFSAFLEKRKPDFSRVE